MVVGSFLPGNQQDLKPKKPKIDAVTAPITPTPTIAAAPIPASNPEREESVGGNGQQISSSLRRENWTTMQSVQDLRKSGTDINVSLAEA